MMRYIFLALLFAFKSVLAQQKERTISVTCYVNAELYMDAGVIAYVSDKAGNISCQGHYVNISNKSKNLFYYLNGNRWVALKPQARTVSYMGGSIKSTSVVNLKVKYSKDLSGSITAKIKTIDLLNARSDKAKSGQVGENQSIAATSKPATTRVSTTATSVSQKTSAPKPDAGGQKETIVAKTQRKPASQSARQVTAEKKQTTNRTTNKTSSRVSSSRSYASKKRSAVSPGMSTRNALGIRVDFGTGATGVGPNYKRYFSNNLALDASLIFFNRNITSLGAQVEKHFSIPSDPGINLYLGAGPQLVFGPEDTALALVPVGGVEYNIPTTPVNISFDWRPSLFLTPGTDSEAGRFGLSLRIRF